MENRAWLFWHPSRVRELDASIRWSFLPGTTTGYRLATLQVGWKKMKDL
jgi:hypothetical protein